MKTRLIATLCVLALSSAAHAQRTDDNVTAQSEDAFGRSVGNERIAILEAEIARLRAAIADRQKTKAAADSIFKL